VGNFQVILSEEIREMAAKVDVCASRNEIKVAMKSIQFDMLNHSNACRSLARAVSGMRKSLDVKVEADDGIDEILRWDNAIRESDAAKRSMKSTPSPSGGSDDHAAPRNKAKAGVASPSDDIPEAPLDPPPPPPVPAPPPPGPPEDGR
jgi:hypothetical protein